MSRKCRRRLRQQKQKNFLAKKVKQAEVKQQLCTVENPSDTSAGNNAQKNRSATVLEQSNNKGREQSQAKKKKPPPGG